MFHGWPAHLPDRVELWAIELPGRGSRLSEPAFTNMQPLADAAAAAIAPYLDTPFVLFGHSMGATISFELARRLRDKYHLAPERLIVSGRRAPHILDNDKPTYNLPEPALIDKLRRMNGTPPEILEDAEIMRFLLPILRADFSVCQTYRYRSAEPLSMPISAYGGTEDDGETPDLLEEWGLQTEAEFSLRLFPGNHFFLHSAQRQFLRTLSEDLSRQLPASSRPHVFPSLQTTDIVPDFG